MSKKENKNSKLENSKKQKLAQALRNNLLRRKAKPDKNKDKGAF